MEYSELAIEMGKRIKSLRLKQGLTIEQLANKLGLARSSVNNWENGRREPTSTQVPTIATILNTTTDYLCGRTDSPYSFNGTINLRDLIMDPEVTYKDDPLTDEQRLMFLRVLESIVQK
ncbi:helix-turn-helix domain-containing protein [Priestia megaterium]|uniref:helix-turn-helix domain-containing protein n=1 Tax=Priestia megaterium TaxID=1404 RepID=UPI00159BDCF6|nr:helix-turn-helix transcriptional regulator [Priestia megaterium]